MKTHKYLKLKQLRIGIQTMKVAEQHIKNCDLCYGYETTQIAMNKGNFFRVAKALRIEPIIEDRHDSTYRYHASFYYEGVTVYCIYHYPIDEPIVKQDWYSDQLNAKFKEYFFETEDKNQAFLKLKEYVLANLNSMAKPEKQPIYWMKSYQEFEKYLKRHNTLSEPYESRYNKYLYYKQNFEPLDEDVSYQDANRLRPEQDWTCPMTFRQWNKANY